MRLRKISKTADGYIVVTLISILWGTTGLFARWSATQPLTILYYQAIITVIVLSCIYLMRRDYPFIPGRYLFLVLLSGILKFFATFFYFTAIQLTTLCYSLFAYYTGPVLMVFFASFFLHEKTDFKTLLSLLVAISGIVFMGLSFGEHTLLSSGVKGIIFAFGGAICFALTIIIVKSLSNLRGIDVLFYHMLFSLPVLFLFSGWPEQLESWASVNILILGVFHACLAYAFYYDALKRVKAQHAGILHYLDPVVASMLGYLVFKESISLGGFFGGALVIFAGIIVISASGPRVS